MSYPKYLQKYLRKNDAGTLRSPLEVKFHRIKCFVLQDTVLGLQALAGLFIPLHNGITTSTSIEEPSANRQITTFTCGMSVPGITIII